MLQTIANAFSVPEIRRKLAFTAAMLLLYRLGAYIPSPGVDVDAVEAVVHLVAESEQVLAQLPELQVISKYGVGLDGIDIDALSRRGIRPRLAISYNCKRRQGGPGQFLSFHTQGDSPR